MGSISADAYVHGTGDPLTIGSVGPVNLDPISLTPVTIQPVVIGTAANHPFQVGVPQPLEVKVDSIGAVGPVELSGIPDTFHIYLEKLPKLQIGLDPLTINPLSIKPVDLNIALKEIPSVRAHLPADFSLGLSVFGLDILCLRLCGEGQIITEPYRPNPCERCGPDNMVPKPPTSESAALTGATL